MAPETPRSPLNVPETLAAGNHPQHSPTSSIPAIAGQLIAGRYLLKRPLGEGGMGYVYLAEDQFLVRQVAVKTIRPELSDNTEVRERIRNECRMHAAIGTHHHIVTLYDSIADNGRLYLIMEYFAGETLAQRLAGQSHGPSFSLEQALHIVHQVLRALACIHSHDIVHRDIKTANILLQGQRDNLPLVKLTDFGIARSEAVWRDQTSLTQLGGQGPGTPAYMAPERIDPLTYGTIGPATDLYAVGIILYEMLAGAPPFKGSMSQVFNGHLMQPPDLDSLPLSVPTSVRQALRKALSKQPMERYQNADAFDRALSAAASAPLHSSDHPPNQQEVTLIADSFPPAQDTATILIPAPSNSSRITWNRSRTIFLLLLLAAAVLLSLGFRVLFHHPLTNQHTETAPPMQALPLEVHIQPGGIQASGNREHSGSALQAVEEGRQSSQTSTTSADRNDADETSSSGWQVLEHQTRKIR